MNGWEPDGGCDAENRTDLWSHYDLGAVQTGSLCRLTLYPFTAPLADAGDVTITLTGAGFEAHAADDGAVVVTIPTGTPGRRSTVVTVSSDDAASRRYSVAAVVGGPDPVDYPHPLDVGQARAVLQRWAAEHVLVPDTLFDGGLKVSDASVVVAAVAIQSATVEMDTTVAPARPDLPLLTEDAEIDADPAHWNEKAGPSILKRSITEMACRSCDDAHRVPCQSCAATGIAECPPLVECPECNGRGTQWAGGKILKTAVKLGAAVLPVVLVAAANRGRNAGQWPNATRLSGLRESVGGAVRDPEVLEKLAGAGAGAAGILAVSASEPGRFRESCPRCQGRGKLPCPDCGGTGGRDCPDCIHGRMSCPTCGGDGVSVRFTTVTRKHTLDEFDMVSGDRALSEQFASHHRPLRMPAADPSGALGSGHGELAAWIDEHAAGYEMSEVVRRLWLAVLPITAVGYTEGELSRTAYLVGAENDLSVYAPKASRPSRARAARTVGHWTEAGRKTLYNDATTSPAAALSKAVRQRAASAVDSTRHRFKRRRTRQGGR